MNEELKGEIVIYETDDGKTRLKVSLKEDTVWLTQGQMIDLFQRDQSVISRHIKNIFKEGELDPKSNMQKMHTANSDKPISFYNLDVIISVGYRVKSHRGTQFRIWATQVLRDYLVKGYSLNERRLREQNHRLEELRKTVCLIGRIVEGPQLEADAATELLKVISDYSRALTLLDEYDSRCLEIRNTTGREGFIVTYEEVCRTIERLNQLYMKEGLPIGLFGIEKDESSRGLLRRLCQIFDSKESSLSIEEKAAHLLYFFIKDLSFVEGNKRIGTSLFIWFLDANGILYARDGAKRIGNNALVALSLLIAESKPEAKDVIIKVIVNLINRDNV